MSKKQIDALKLALEALVAAFQGKDKTGQVTDAITAIREALAENALDRMAENARELGLDYEPPCKTGSQCTSKCQQCEQPAQQHVVEHQPCKGMNCGITRTDQEHSLECQAEHAAAIAGGAFVKPAQQEPVAYSYTSRITGAQGFSHHPMPRFIDSESWDIKPLYTSPPASKPLTDAQIGAVAADIWGSVLIAPQSYQTFARAIEAAHGIKENT